VTTVATQDRRGVPDRRIDINQRPGITVRMAIETGAGFCGSIIVTAGLYARIVLELVDMLCLVVDNSITADGVCVAIDAAV
jgi:hypothetical protein